MGVDGRLIDFHDPHDEASLGVLKCATAMGSARRAACSAFLVHRPPSVCIEMIAVRTNDVTSIVCYPIHTHGVLGGRNLRALGGVLGAWPGCRRWGRQHTAIGFELYQHITKQSPSKTQIFQGILLDTQNLFSKDSVRFLFNLYAR
jgi:hypothetical protein